MTRAADMLDSTPATFDFDRDALAECIAACFECAQTCTACADACLSESNVADLVRCIRLDLDCADVCEATRRVLSRQTAYDATLTRGPGSVRDGLQELRGRVRPARRARHEALPGLAEACRRCEQACRTLLSAAS